MTYLLLSPLFLVAWLWLFFLLYIGAMGIMRAYHAKQLNVWLYVMCLPFLVIAYLYAVLSNLTIVSIIYVELPKQLTVTERLKKHIDSQTWRGELSRFICKKILSPFDHTGDHCD